MKPENVLLKQQGRSGIKVIPGPMHRGGAHSGKDIRGYTRAHTATAVVIIHFTMFS